MKYFTPFSVESKMFETVHSKTQTFDINRFGLTGSQLSSQIKSTFLIVTDEIGKNFKIRFPWVGIIGKAKYESR